MTWSLSLQSLYVGRYNVQTTDMVYKNHKISTKCKGKTEEEGRNVSCERGFRRREPLSGTAESWSIKYSRWKKNPCETRGKQGKCDNYSRHKMAVCNS